MRCFALVWVALTVTWSAQISSGCLVDSLGLLAGSIGLMCSIIPYAVLRFSLGWIGGYLVRSDIFGRGGRLFRIAGCWISLTSSIIGYATVGCSVVCLDDDLVGWDIFGLVGRLLQVLRCWYMYYSVYDWVCWPSLLSR